MRTINSTLQAKLTAGNAQLCHLVTITRADGGILRYTDLDHDVSDGTHTWESDTSLSLSAITSSANNGIQSTTCGVIFSDSGISTLDTVRGVYDSATMLFQVMDYVHPEYGKITLLTGTLSVISVTNKDVGQFEVSGLLNKGGAVIGAVYSPQCRADLGDSRCTVNLASFTDTGVVSTVTSATFLKVDLTGNPPDGQYSFGLITFTSGLNTGITMEILNQYAFDATYDVLYLALAFPYTIGVGDTFSIIAGCDKTPSTCKNKFSNLVNFRAEQFVPGSDVTRPVVG